MADTGTSIQAYLDSLSQDPGSVLYRNINNWEALPPGDQGQVLSVGPDSMPTWKGFQTYFPALYKFNGTTARYQIGYTSAGSKITTVARILSGPFTGGGVATLVNNSNAAGRIRTLIQQFASDHATANFRNRIRCLVQNSVGATVCALFSPALAFLDSTPRYLWFEFDGPAGTAKFLNNTIDCDDTTNGSRIAPSVATLGTGASTGLYIAYNGASTFYGGMLGAFGFHEVTGLDPEDFCNALGYPVDIEGSMATAWGGTPKLWHESGKLDENRGSIGNMTPTAGITLAFPSAWS